MSDPRDPINPEEHPELFEREEVYVGSPGPPYGVAIVVAALAVFFLILALTA